MTVNAADSQTEEIIAKIKTLKNKVSQSGDFDFAAFFDFDGTIVAGDITEGYENHYVGLAEKAIKAGLAKEKSFSRFIEKYEELLQESHEKAYVYVAELFANLTEEQYEKLHPLIDEHFAKTLQKHYFHSSIGFLEELHKAGVQIHIVSASPSIFVKAAQKTLPYLPSENFTGINRQRDGRGRLKDPIVNYGEGKVLRLRRLTTGKNRKVFPLAAFGNSWSTDGPFLKWLARQGGVAVMINGKKAPKEKHGCWLVRQERLISED